MLSDYEMVLGLEVHVELNTATKIFCGCAVSYGDEPNTHCCPVCMGFPGTLPVLNQKVVEYAIKAGIATNCTIASYSKQDRKNYFYPDLPKAYQISQYDLPLCENGYLTIETENGPKRIGITRIHIEEDAGKLVHDPQKGTFIDCNRCGVPLIEIVSEPDMRSEKEADAYLRKLRSVIRYTGISECKMNEGAFRCDVNLSVRKKGETAFGTRTEMKNLNSFQFISKAISYEYQRQVAALEAGETIVQETRRFDRQTGKTFSMRGKENADDYRYFPDPDLPPIENDDAFLREVEASIPTLPDERKASWIEKYGLPAYDCEQLLEEKEIADYFETALKDCSYPKILSNLMLSEVFRLLPETGKIPVPPTDLAAIANMEGKEILSSSAAKKVLRECFETKERPEDIVEKRGLTQISDPELLLPFVLETIQENPKMVSDYQSGKTNAVKALMGSLMKKSGGKGNPKVLSSLLEDALSRL